VCVGGCGCVCVCVYRGHSIIWGKKAKGMVAEYTTADGATKSSLLLMSGWYAL